MKDQRFRQHYAVLILLVLLQQSYIQAQQEDGVELTSEINLLTTVNGKHPQGVSVLQDEPLEDPQQQETFEANEIHVESDADEARPVAPVKTAFAHISKGSRQLNDPVVDDATHQNNTQTDKPKPCWGCDAPHSETKTKSADTKHQAPVFTNHVHPHNKLTVPSNHGGQIQYHKYNAATFGQGNLKLPPEGFHITAAVYTGADGLSHFWINDEHGLVENDESAQPTSENSTSSGESPPLKKPKTSRLPHIPFLECNAVGSTTATLPFKHGTIRHFPCGAEPKSFSPTPHPGQLLICLSRLELIVSGNSEETRTFEPGDVILLEDTLGNGHKLRAACGESHYQDMTVMLLTLAHPAEHDPPPMASPFIKSPTKSGGGWSIFKKAAKSKDSAIPAPCRTEYDPSFSSYYDATDDTIPASVDTEDESLTATEPNAILSNPNPGSIKFLVWNANRKRTIVLAGIGSAASVVGSIWLSKVAPIFVTLVFGGGCLAVGGTCAFVSVGDKLLDNVDTWYREWQYRQSLTQTQSQDNSQSQQQSQAKENIVIEEIVETVPETKNV